MEFVLPSCVWGYHVYGEDWIAVLGEKLVCEREIGNVVDRYAVAVKKDSGKTVGHMPKKISRMCSSFLQQGYVFTATVTGCCRYSSDLLQGGLEIPCDLRFLGDKKASLS